MRFAKQIVFRYSGDPNTEVERQAQELFADLRETTRPAYVLIFPNPGTLALFTHRAADLIITNAKM